jgi:hypothetical protein
MRPDTPRRLAFVYLESFERTSKGILSDEDMARVEIELSDNPYAGKVISDTGGVRKVRAAIAGRGKRGGARILYYYVDPRLTVYFLFAYVKNRQSDVTPAQKAFFRQIIEEIKKGR